jgi:hypothetical protein
MILWKTTASRYDLTDHHTHPFKLSKIRIYKRLKDPKGLVIFTRCMGIFWLINVVHDMIFIQRTT